MIRLILAVLGVLGVLIGRDAHSPTVMVVGLAAMVPLLARLLTLPVGVRRAGFWLSAIVAGLVLAGFAAGHPDNTGTATGTDQSRPAPAACVAGVHR
jgi:hypothetical protein